MNPTPPPPPPAGGPSTREIPLVPPTGATAATAVAQPTGPVDWVPGPPATPEAPQTVEAPAAQETARPFLLDLADEPTARRVPAGTRLAALVLGVVAAAALEFGLFVQDGTASLWSRTPWWSAFATLAVLAGLAGVAGRLAGSRPAARPLAAAGMGGLAVFWLLVALPAADTDRGFLLTAALGCLAVAVWAAGRGADTTASRVR